MHVMYSFNIFCLFLSMSYCAYAVNITAEQNNITVNMLRKGMTVDQASCFLRNIASTVNNTIDIFIVSIPGRHLNSVNILLDAIIQGYKQNDNGRAKIQVLVKGHEELTNKINELLIHEELAKEDEEVKAINNLVNQAARVSLEESTSSNAL